MLTRDPLQVPCKTDRYWIAMDRPAPERGAFSNTCCPRRRLVHCHITGLAPADQIALETNSFVDRWNTDGTC
jgi:hypothetical protein